MRRLAPLCLLLLGASAGFPAGAQAGLPGAGPRDAGGPFHRHDGAIQPADSRASGAVHAPTYNHDARCMCPDCQVMRAIQEAEGAPVIIHGSGPGTGAPCAACETSVTAGTIVPMAPGEAPGYAHVGGYTHAGGPGMASSEPTPIGVVQANFSQPGPVDPSIAAFHQAARPMSVNHNHAGQAMQAAPWMGLPSPPRRSMLGRMIGFRGPLTQWREAREARRAEEHAAIPMGQPAANARISELPASMVYGR